MTMPIERILAVAQGARRTGPDRWMAKSPLVPDQRTGSVSVRELGDGTILLHDFGGGAVEDVVAAWNLGLADLFPESLPVASAVHYHKPQSRHLLGASDALRLIERETAIVTMAALNLGHGVALTDEDRARLLVAARRIHEIMVEAAS